MGDNGTGAAAADWYADPCGRHELRYWDGAAWTENVADAGQAGVDPVDGAQAGATGGETLLMTLPKSTDVAWGGFCDLHLTNGRLIVETVLGTGAAMASVAAGGVIGATIAGNAAQNRHQTETGGAARTVDQILQGGHVAYAIEYADITEMVLTKKALPIGYSRCKIRSAQKNVTLAFKREFFDEASALLVERLPGKVTVK